MSEEDIRLYLSGKAKPAPQAKAVRRIPKRAANPAQPESYEKFSASHIFCPTCRKANPVRERIMLFLPDGDLYEYSCTVCSTSVGTRKAGQ